MALRKGPKIRSTLVVMLWVLAFPLSSVAGLPESLKGRVEFNVDDSQCTPYEWEQGAWTGVEVDRVRHLPLRLKESSKPSPNYLFELAGEQMSGRKRCFRPFVGHWLPLWEAGLWGWQRSLTLTAPDGASFPLISTQVGVHLARHWKRQITGTWAFEVGPAIAYSSSDLSEPGGGRASPVQFRSKGDHVFTAFAEVGASWSAADPGMSLALMGMAGYQMGSWESSTAGYVVSPKNSVVLGARFETQLWRGAWGLLPAVGFLDGLKQGMYWSFQLARKTF